MLKPLSSVIIWFCVLAGSPLLGQVVQPSFLSLTTEDGLPSNEVYDVFEDLQGYLWFSTDRGIARYDSDQFQNFSTENGLADNTNFHFEQDDEGTFWVNGFQGSLSFWNGQSFAAFKYNDQIRGLLKPNQWVEPYRTDRDSIYFFTVLSKGVNIPHYAIHKASGTIRKLPSPEEGHYFNSTLNPDMEHTLRDMEVSTSNHQRNDLGVGAKRKECAPKNNPLIIKLFEIVQQHAPVTKLMLDRSGNLWFATQRGIWICTSSQKQGPWRKVLEDHFITDLLQDREGNLWITTLNKGIIMLPALAVEIVYRDHQQNVDILEICGDHLIAAFQNNQLLILDSNHAVKKWPGVSFSHISNATNHSNHFRLQRFFKKRDKFYTHQTKQGPILRFLLDKINVFSNGHNVRPDSTWPLNTFEIIQQPEDRFWMATSRGLYHLDVRPTLPLRAPVPVYSESLDAYTRLNTICTNDSGLLWIGSLGKGVFYKTPTGIYPLKHPKLIGNQINRLLLENDSTLWIGTNLGLNRVIFRKKNDQVGLINVQAFTRENGLPSSYISDLAIWQNRIYVATSRGICRFSSNELKEFRIRPLLFLNKVSISGTEVSGDSVSLSELRHDQNDLRFAYTGINHHKPANVDRTYRFRLLHKKQPAVWSYTGQRTLQFINLDHGQYTLQVQCQNTHGIWSSTMQVPFHIQPHLLQTAWFWPLICSLSMLFIVVIAVIQIRSLKAKSVQKQLFHEAELAVLKTQMNPHFLANALSAVQHFMVKGKTMEACDFLGQFSRLIRDSLHFSSQKLIPITREMEFLENYLSLEQVRFQHRFSYALHRDSSLAKTIQIPPMMVQPLVENALKHAFKSMDEGGTVHINFALGNQSETLVVQVVDNGSGLPTNLPKNQPKNGGYSVGLRILKQRISYFNQYLNSDAGALNLSSSKNRGTVAELVLPYRSSTHD